jgi:U3 small nucleolar ribonucleoprotein component
MFQNAFKGAFMSDAELFELVRENYHKANRDYIQKQLSIAAEYLTEEQKAELRRELKRKDGDSHDNLPDVCRCSAENVDGRCAD